jgi:hypothetical protein
MILSATHLIITANVFQFDNTYWMQLSSTAMGTSLACMYATIYYSYHEETSLLHRYHPHGGSQTNRPLLLYARLINDAFQVWDFSQLPQPFTITGFVPTLQQQMAFGTLTWEAETPSRQVNFLDLTIAIEPDGSISTKTFIKSMNLHLYIPPSSAHTKGVLKSLIFGNLQRYS